MAYEIPNIRWSPERIKKLRLRLGMTQEEFGTLLGYQGGAKNHISAFERGKSIPIQLVSNLLTLVEERSNGHADHKRK